MINSKHLMTIHFTSGTSTVNQGFPGGERVVVQLSGGEFSGAELKGQVVSGSDWVTKYPDGSMALDVRAQLVTHEGGGILMRYRGFRTVEEGETSIRTSVFFETGVGSPHAWLNRAVCYGWGTRTSTGATYEVYILRAPVVEAQA